MNSLDVLKAYRNLVLSKETLKDLALDSSENTQETIRLMQRRLQSLLSELAPPMRDILKRIPDIRTLMIVKHYYVLGWTERQIALELRLSVARINQLRTAFLNSLEQRQSA